MMQRAGKVIRGLNLPEGCLSLPFVAVKVWPSAVGRRIAGRTRAVALEGSRLIVEVEDEVWQGQLRSLAPQILQQVQDLTGGPHVKWIDFRVAVARRPARRASLDAPVEAGRTGTLLDGVPALPDEANAIEDPVFRTLYKISRKRANQ